MSVHGDHGSGAVKRRRDRRLRMHWWHEQLTLQMALAAALHHSRDVGVVTYNAPRSQKTTRAGEWGREQNYTAKTGIPTPQPQLFSLYEEEPGGVRRSHVPILDVPVPQMGDQVVGVLRKFDVPSVEQVIAVPMISFDRVPQRSATRCPQKAEQLVEVPTVVSFSSLQRSEEPNIDIPVPRRGGGGRFKLFRSFA